MNKEISGVEETALTDEFQLINVEGIREQKIIL